MLFKKRVCHVFLSRLSSQTDESRKHKLSANYHNRQIYTKVFLSLLENARFKQQRKSIIWHFRNMCDQRLLQRVMHAWTSFLDVQFQDQITERRQMALADLFLKKHFFTILKVYSLFQR